MRRPYYGRSDVETQLLLEQGVTVASSLSKETGRRGKSFGLYTLPLRML